MLWLQRSEISRGMRTLLAGTAVTLTPWSLPARCNIKGSDRDSSVGTRANKSIETNSGPETLQTQYLRLRLQVSHHDVSLPSIRYTGRGCVPAAPSILFNCTRSNGGLRPPEPVSMRLRGQCDMLNGWSVVGTSRKTPWPPTCAPLFVLPRFNVRD